MTFLTLTSETLLSSDEQKITVASSVAFSSNHNNQVLKDTIRALVDGSGYVKKLCRSGVLFTARFRSLSLSSAWTKNLHFLSLVSCL